MFNRGHTAGLVRECRFETQPDLCRRLAQHRGGHSLRGRRQSHCARQRRGYAIDTVVSNCHVIEKANTASVLYQNKHFAATLRYEDSERDLCSFAVKGLSAPPVQMGYTSQVQVGDAAYAIGAPEGLALTLSGGLISSLRKIPGGVVLQMTTPISPGSSGGGLFDSEGRLIGITSYYMKEGEQLNFALRVEWVNELPKRGKLTTTNTIQFGQTAHVAQVSNFERGIRALQAGNYTTALAIFETLAKEGNVGAQFQLGWMYDNGLGVPQDYSQAQTWYRKAAAQGNANAQSNLGTMYGNGQGVSQDYTKAAAWFLKAAAQGEAEAQFNLGFMYTNDHGVPQDYSQALTWYRKAAEQGNARAQDSLGNMYAKGQGEPQDYARANIWFRKAAAQNDAVAQNSLGVLYEFGAGVSQDYIAAYALFNLSASLSSLGDNMAATNRSKLMDSMTPSQIAAGQALTREMQRIGVIKALDEYLKGGAQ